MANLPGVFLAQKKDGSTYYRASITYRSKHISLGSYTDESSAHQAYSDACMILNSNSPLLPEDYSDQQITFKKWVVLTNFKNNGLYIKTPIYLRHKYFHYYLSQTDVLIFDVDDLFYYSNHSIIRRGNHLFVSDYGMQVNIASRYGIKNFAVKDRDYRFVNGDDHDFRYANLEIINSYQGVIRMKDNLTVYYQTQINVKGTLIVGRYPSENEAAIAYNKAADLLTKNGFTKTYTQNYLTDLSASEYAKIYHNLELDRRFLKKIKQISTKNN